MMRKVLMLCVILAAAMTYAEEIETRKSVKKSAAIPSNNEFEAKTDAPEVGTEKVEIVKETTELPSSTLAVTVEESTAEKVEVTTVREEAAITPEAPSPSPSTTEAHKETTEENAPPDQEESTPDVDNNILPLSETPKRKVLYINQQQSGKLNVHLELSDVSVIVIPNQKDPQLSLLSLLFKSAQKSKLNEAKMKEENLKAMPMPAYHDEYSKYSKQPIRSSDENYHHHVPAGMPYIESRAPYKVDISSTLTGQQTQPAVEVNPSFARSAIMQLLKPIPFTIQTAPNQPPVPANRIFKRSIDTRLLGIDDEMIPDDSLNYVNYGDGELTEAILNSLDNNDDLNMAGGNGGSEFLLLGATEQCGPGRRRNSYQICVAIDDFE